MRIFADGYLNYIIITTQFFERLFSQPPRGGVSWITILDRMKGLNWNNQKKNCVTQFNITVTEGPAVSFQVPGFPGGSLRGRRVRFAFSHATVEVVSLVFSIFKSGRIGVSAVTSASEDYSDAGSLLDLMMIFIWFLVRAGVENGFRRSVDVCDDQDWVNPLNRHVCVVVCFVCYVRSRRSTPRVITPACEREYSSTLWSGPS